MVPYDYLESGKVFFIPLCFQVAVNLVLSLVVFPSSVSANYLAAFQALINPAQTATAALLALFESGSEGDASLDDWIALGQVLTAARAKSQTEGLGVMMGMSDCLKADFSLGRAGPEDLDSLGEKAKDIVLRAGGGESSSRLSRGPRILTLSRPVPQSPSSLRSSRPPSGTRISTLRRSACGRITPNTLTTTTCPPDPTRPTPRH